MDYFKDIDDSFKQSFSKFILEEYNKILKIDKFYINESYIDDSEEIIDLNVEEGIDEVKSKYPLINENDFMKLIKLDPTYKGGKTLGKYGKWILNRYYTILKDKLSYNKWKEQKKLGSTYPQPQKKSNDTIKDFDNVNKLLSDYDVMNKRLKLNIDNIKSINDLHSVIKKGKEEGISNNIETEKLLSLFRKAIVNGADLLFRSPTWIVISPSTIESSKVFGNITKWCTTSPNGHEYSIYTNSDKNSLLINFDLKNNKLYQFHFDTGHYTDQDNKNKTFLSIVSKNKDVKNFYSNYLLEKIEKNIHNKNKDLNFHIVKALFSINKDVSEKTLLDMVKKSGSSIQYIKSPSINLQKEAIDNKWWAINFIKNPPKEIIDYTLSKYPEYKDDIIKLYKN